MTTHVRAWRSNTMKSTLTWVRFCMMNRTHTTPTTITAISHGGKPLPGPALPLASSLASSPAMRLTRAVPWGRVFEHVVKFHAAGVSRAWSM